MQQRKVQCTEVQRAYCRAHISLQAAIFNNSVTSYKVLKGWKWSINNIQEVRQTWLIYIVLLALEGGCACNISWILGLWRRKTQHKSLFILLSMDSFFKSLLENFAIIFGGIMTPPFRPHHSPIFGQPPLSQTPPISWQSRWKVVKSSHLRALPSAARQPLYTKGILFSGINSSNNSFVSGLHN